MTCILKSTAGRTWSGKVGADANRTYSITYIVLSDSKADGPNTALQTPGLPQPGDLWQIGNDNDEWATCLADSDADPMVDDGPNYQWKVTKKFSTKPPPHNDQRCNDVPVGDPILEPPKVSGGFTKFTEEAVFNRFGFPILTSSFEQMRGHQVEFDNNRPHIKIEQNVASPYQAYVLPAMMADKVNAYPLWGFPARCIKLSTPHWDRKYYGRCSVYYTRTLEFDINSRTWDRDLLDEGTKAINGVNRNGQWIVTPISSTGQMPDRNNPMHFIQYKDAHNENCRVVLDGFGHPVGRVTAVIPPGPGDQNYYISISDNIAVTPPNTGSWLPQVGGDTYWNSTDEYLVGDVVIVIVGTQPKTYIAKVQNKGGASPEFNGTAWLLLDNGVVDRGVWNATTTYKPGDRVYLGAPGTGTFPIDYKAGYIHVERYSEADFLELGIPADF